MDTARTFVGLAIAPESRERIAAYVERLRATTPPRPRVGWIAPERMHVTLKFLGAIDPVIAPALGDAVRALTLAESPPAARARAVTAFSSPARAHVIVLDLEDTSGALGRLANATEKGTEALGFARELRAFHPHVTVARLRERSDVRAWLAGAPPPDEIGDVTFTEIALFRSDPSPQGSIYTPIAASSFTR